jgi:hypothetical protein
LAARSVAGASRSHPLRIALALWLGIAALAANAVEQQQLNGNVITAAYQDFAAAKAGPGFHVMPDGTVMAGSMSHMDAGEHRHAGPGGHTHKGHMDCEVCGAVAAMAAITLPALPEFPLPKDEFHAAPVIGVHTIATGRRYSAYASRAPPPDLMI